MAAKTKMIIITSDEDLIKQLSTKNNQNTSVINLDDHGQAITTDNQNNASNVAILTGLSQFVRIFYRKNIDKN